MLIRIMNFFFNEVPDVRFYCWLFYFIDGNEDIGDCEKKMIV